MDTAVALRCAPLETLIDVPALLSFSKTVENPEAFNWMGVPVPGVLIIPLPK